MWEIFLQGYILWALVGMHALIQAPAQSKYQVNYLSWCTRQKISLGHNTSTGLLWKFFKKYSIPVTTCHVWVKKIQDTWISLVCSRLNTCTTLVQTCLFVRYIEGSTSAKVECIDPAFVLLQWTSSEASKCLEFSRTKKSPVLQLINGHELIGLNMCVKRLRVSNIPRLLSVG